MQQKTDVEIKEEFAGEAFRQQINKVLIQIAGAIRGKFEDEICVGTHHSPVGLAIYEFPCIFTARTVTRKKLWVFRKKAVEKKMVLEIIADNDEIDLCAYDERVVEAAKEAFEKLKGSKDEFKDYKIVIKKDFKTAG